MFCVDLNKVTSYTSSRWLTQLTTERQEVNLGTFTNYADNSFFKSGSERTWEEISEETLQKHRKAWDKLAEL